VTRLQSIILSLELSLMAWFGLYVLIRALI
jgi:hypothetical protein